MVVIVGTCPNVKSVIPMFVPFGITSFRPSAVVNERFVIVDVWLTLMVVAAPHD